MVMACLFGGVLSGCGLLADLPTADCGDDCADSSDCTGDLICDENGVCAAEEGDCTETSSDDDCLTACNVSDDCSDSYICNSEGLCALDDAGNCNE
jgi:hypothetical protein